MASRSWRTTPEVGSSRLVNGALTERPDWKIHLTPVTCPEVFRQIHLAGVLWTYQFEPDTPLTYDGRGRAPHQDAILPFTELELAVKEYVLHDNIKPLAEYLASPSISARQYRRILCSLALTFDEPNKPAPVGASSRR